MTDYPGQQSLYSFVRLTNGLELYSVKYSLSAYGLSNIMFNIMQMECRYKLVPQIT